MISKDARNVYICILVLCSLAGAVGTMCIAVAAISPPVPTPWDGLYEVYLSRDYFALESQLAKVDAQDPRREFFQGQLDAAFLHDPSAEEELHHFLGQPSMPAGWRAEAWLTLVRTEMRRGEYPLAAEDSDAALKDNAGDQDSQTQGEIKSVLKMAQALRSTPPQCRSDKSTTSVVNAIWSERGSKSGGSVSVDYRVNGLTQSAIFDTGDTLNMASRSFADVHKLKLIPVHIAAQSVTGEGIESQMGIADEVQIGAMIFHNVVFVVLPDGATVNFRKYGYDSSIGLPIILALERVHMSIENNSLTIGAPAGSDNSGQLPPHNLAFTRKALLLRTEYEGTALPFGLDTGATGTLLFEGFGRQFPKALVSARQGGDVLAGLGKNMEQQVQFISEIAFSVGDRTSAVRDIPVVAKHFQSASVYGSIGSDFLQGGYEIDFRQMHLSLLGEKPPYRRPLQ